jgi:hypothetical protein
LPEEIANTFSNVTPSKQCYSGKLKKSLFQNDQSTERQLPEGPHDALLTQEVDQFAIVLC